jgi:hypothetical protein
MRLCSSPLLSERVCSAGCKYAGRLSAGCSVLWAAHFGESDEVEHLRGPEVESRILPHSLQRMAAEARGYSCSWSAFVGGPGGQWRAGGRAGRAGRLRPPLDELVLVVSAPAWLHCPQSTAWLRTLLDSGSRLRQADDKVLKLLGGVASRAR